MDFKPAFPGNETVSCIRISAPTLDDLLAIVNDGLKTPLETFSVKDLSVKRPTHILALISLASWWPSSRSEGNDLNGRVWGCNGSDVDAEIQSPVIFREEAPNPGADGQHRNQDGFRGDASYVFSFEVWTEKVPLTWLECICRRYWRRDVAIWCGNELPNHTRKAYWLRNNDATRQVEITEHLLPPKPPYFTMRRP
jgi:hypothetical protein